MLQLPYSKYSLALPRLAEVPFNTNFAEAVLRGEAGGMVYADDPELPRAFLIAHRCGMSLLVGDSDRADFVPSLQAYLVNGDGTRTRPELLQAFPGSWDDRIRALLAERLIRAADFPEGLADPYKLKASTRSKAIEWARLNYRFNADEFSARRPAPLSAPFYLDRSGAATFAGWEGAIMPPRVFWDDVAEFDRRGMSAGVMHGDQIASVAYAAFVFADRAEIAIETNAAFRGRGLAVQACAAFIDECLTRGIEPVWSCRKGNAGSERTARALGFQETRQIAYFGLIE